MERHTYTIVGIIALAGVVFALQQGSEDNLYTRYATIPSDIVEAWDALRTGGPTAAVVGKLGTLLSATVMHADVSHILGNAVFLWIFGTLVAQQLGRWTAPFLFAFTGLVGSIVHVVLNRDSSIPMIGASGAVCGFEGVYLGLALQWRLAWPDVWPIAHPIPPMQLALLAALGFAMDVYGVMSRGHGVAYGAHIGGLLAGLLIAAILTTIFQSEKDYERSMRWLYKA